MDKKGCVINFLLLRKSLKMIFGDVRIGTRKKLALRSANINFGSLYFFLKRVLSYLPSQNSRRKEI